jgi:hypothetical protein
MSIIIFITTTCSVFADDYTWLKDNSIYSITQTYKFDKVDKYLYTSFTTFQVTDLLQTNYIFEHPEKYRERFPLARWAERQAGDAGVVSCFIIGNIATYKVAKHLKPVPRKILFIAVNGIEMYSSYHNYNHGVNFSYSLSF